MKKTVKEHLKCTAKNELQMTDRKSLERVENQTCLFFQSPIYKICNLNDLSRNMLGLTLKQKDLGSGQRDISKPEVVTTCPLPSMVLALTPTLYQTLS